MHGYGKFCNKIYQATKYVLGKLDDFVPRESSALTGKESLAERWILMKLNTAVKEINQAFEDREFAKSAQISYRHLYYELFDVHIENSKSIISTGTAEEVRSAKHTLYTALESGLRLLAPFMPFLAEELWQRLPRRPNDQTCSITIANYPEYDSSLHDPISERAYELVLGCSKGIRSLLSDYAVKKDKGLVYISPLNQSSHAVVSEQLSTIKSLSGKTVSSLDINILNVGEVSPTSTTGCAVFPISADANVYLRVKDSIQDAKREAEKFQAKLTEARREEQDVDSVMAELSKVQGKDVTAVMQLAERRKRDVSASLRALEEPVTMVEKMIILDP